MTRPWYRLILEVPKMNRIKWTDNVQPATKPRDLMLVSRQVLIEWQASYQRREADSYRQGVVFGVAVAVVVLVCSAMMRPI